jgi:DNA-binding NarL/FixJ family response regulator
MDGKNLPTRPLAKSALLLRMPPEGSDPPATGIATSHRQVASSEPEMRANSGEIVIIEFRTLLRECMVGAFDDFEGYRVTAVPTVEHWLEAATHSRPAVILLGGTSGQVDSRAQLSLVSESHGTVPKILVRDGEEPEEVVEALALGARGFISTGTALTVAVQAVRLVLAGGIFIPAGSLIAARESASQPMATRSRSHDEPPFTGRQATIVEALSRGKANKTIAYELNMCESTVKRHVRTIMKKLKAKNRTEVAAIASGLLADRAAD